jgi:imidazolonepropionase-like amidohydrolase
MKQLFVIFTLFLFFLNSNAQIKYSDEAKSFIDYDTAVIVFQHGLLIDGTGNTPKPKQTVIINNGKISWVGDDEKAAIPKGAQQIDLNGKALLPGFVMLHEHMYISAFSNEPMFLHLKQLPVTFPRLYLAAGATTIRTCGSVEPYEDLRIKKDIDAGKMVGPYIDLTGPYLEGRQPAFAQMNELKSADDAVKFVNYWADQGITSFKAYINIDKATLKAAIDAAHKRHLKVTGHLCAVTYREAAELGIDHLEHGFLASTDFSSQKKENECPMSDSDSSFAQLDIGSEPVKNLISFLVDKKVGLTSTLAVFEGYISTQHLLPQNVLDAYAPDSREYYLKEFARSKSPEGDVGFDKIFMKAAKMEKMFYGAGGLLTVGTDPTGNGGVLAGYGSWRAIELLVEADGFTPLQAIKIATLNGAIALGLDKDAGTIERGKHADLIIVDGDPSQNISDIRKISLVFKNGIGYNSKRLFESVKGKVGFY